MPVEPLDHHLAVEHDLLADGLVELFAPEERASFARLVRILGAHQGVELQERLGRLRRSYRPFDPTRDTARPASEDTSADAREAFLVELAALVERANYRELPHADLERALEEVSPQGVQVLVDLDGLSTCRVFARGRFRREVVARRWPRRVVATEGYLRLLLAVALDEEPERLYLRLYRDVARTDLEMYLPNTKVRMRLTDKLVIGLTGGGGTLGGVAATVTKVGAATSPQGWLFALGGLGAVLWRQVTKVFHQRTRYLARHKEALWFHGLDNDLGALVHVAQMALAEESKEALLAYALLATAPGRTLDAARLDAAAEEHLLRRHAIGADFEVDDGLAKLVALEIVEALGPDRYRALAPAQAFRRVDELWDARFVPEA